MIHFACHENVFSEDIYPLAKSRIAPKTFLSMVFIHQKNKYNKGSNGIITKEIFAHLNGSIPPNSQMPFIVYWVTQQMVMWINKNARYLDFSSYSHPQ